MPAEDIITIGGLDTASRVTQNPLRLKWSSVISYTMKNMDTEISWRSRILSLRNVRWFLRMIWRANPPILTLTFVLRIIRGGLPVGMLWVSRLIVDRVLSHIRVPQEAGVTPIWGLLVLELALAICSDVMTRINTMLESILSDQVIEKSSVLLMEHAAKLDLLFFESHRVFDQLERARQDTNTRLGVLVALLNAIQDFVSLCFMSVGIILFSPWLISLLIIAILPTFIGESCLSSLEYSALYRWTPQRRQLDYFRTLCASTESAKEVKLLELGEYLINRYIDVSRHLCDESKSLGRRRAAKGAGLNLISTCAYYGAYMHVIVGTMEGRLSIGTFTFLTGAFSRSRVYLERIFMNVNSIFEHALHLGDLVSFLNTKPLIVSKPGALLAPRRIQSGIELRNVTFRYPGASGNALEKLCLRIHPDERIAIIGENGAGKSTIIKLLTRLYDPTEGAILLDGVDLRDYDVPSLRRGVAVIFQDYMRYAMTAGENIGLGDIRAVRDQMRIESAAQNSAAATFIDSLPMRYEQILGTTFPGGIGLSGGEWQRIALARAYMRDCQLLLLDEPTATLDAGAEYEVFGRIAELTIGRMAVIISHKFSTIRLCTRIVVLEKGRIEKCGTHEELLTGGGRYAHLFKLQAEGYR